MDEREEFVNNNFVSLLGQRDKKIARQSAEIARLHNSNQQGRLHIRALQRKIAKLEKLLEVTQNAYLKIFPTSADAPNVPWEEYD